MHAGFAWIAWVVLLILGAIWAEHRGARPEAAELVASRALPQNTLLMPAQLLPARFFLTYVVRPGGIPAGQSVRAADVGPQPELHPVDPGTILASVPVDWLAVLDGVNAGTKVALCRGATAVATDVGVQTVHCGVAADGKRSCTAVIALPAASQPVLEIIGKADLAARPGKSC
jgi:hypothetical protein